MLLPQNVIFNFIFDENPKLMNKLFRFVFLSFLAFFISISTAFSQEKFTEGKIVYEMTYSFEGLAALPVPPLPTEMVIYAKKSLSRIETKMDWPLQATLIIDSKDTSGVMLVDVDDKKFVLDVDKNILEENTKDYFRFFDYEVIETNRTTNVDNYLYKEAVWIDKINNQSDTILYIPYNYVNVFSPQLMSIQGFPLKIRCKMQQGHALTIRMKTITSEKLNDSLFITPRGYKKTSWEDLLSYLINKHP